MLSPFCANLPIKVQESSSQGETVSADADEVARAWASDMADRIRIGRSRVLLTWTQPDKGDYRIQTAQAVCMPQYDESRGACPTTVE
jgi:hypothetical protein